MSDNGVANFILPTNSEGITSVGVCTDTHFWPISSPYISSEGNLQLQNMSELLTTVLLEQLGQEQLEAVLHLGDVSCGGGTYLMTCEEFYAAQDEIRRGFAELTTPSFCLPGNHDCPPGGGDWSYFGHLWGLEAGAGVTLDCQSARLVLINAQGHSKSQIEEARPSDPISGWVGDRELARLDAALAGAGDRPVIVFIHQLLHPWSTERTWANFYGVENGDAVLEIIARHGNVRCIFQGHAHMLDVQQVQIGDQPCWFIVTPAIIEYPIAWLRLDLEPGKLHMELKPLPVPELARMSQESGNGQEWRIGQCAWHDMTFDLSG